MNLGSGAEAAGTATSGGSRRGFLVMMGADFLEEMRCLCHRDELAEILSYYAADRQLRKKPQLYPMTTINLAAIEGMVG